MSNPEVRLYNRCAPLVAAGETIELVVEQTLEDPQDRLQPTGPKTVKLVVAGPQLKLTPDDIAGVYPAPGSEESPDEFLPHIALRRRTLPWERYGSYMWTPWMALLVFKQSELAYTSQKAGKPGALVHTATLAEVETVDPHGHFTMTSFGKYAPSLSADWVYLTNAQAQRLLPRRDDLNYLAHVKRVTENGVDVDHAIVIASRLPDAGPPGSLEKAEPHAAMLVSLEHRSDLWGDTRKNDPSGRTALIVLHHWTFTPSRGGDFEQVMQAIRYRPNGGVLRFGNLPEPLPSPQAPSLSGGFPSATQPDGVFHEPLLHEQVGKVVFRSPLRPFQPAGRTPGFAVRPAPEEFDAQDPDTPLDYSHATAFELGRLLALADAGILDDLRNMHPTFPFIEPPLAVNQLPPALQKPDWVSNPAWVETPWEMAQTPLLEHGGIILGAGEIDLGGIAQAGQWIGTLGSTLEPLATPVAPAVSTIDIGAVTPEKLGVQFVAVQTAAQS